jgi:YHS domain-containing protein
VDESKAKAAGFRGTFKNQTYYFCSAGCQQHFEKNPERYAAKPDGGQEAGGGGADDKKPAEAVRVKDPVCGHEVDETQAKAAGLTGDYEGKTYYFCSYNCNKQFDKDSERYIHKGAQAVGDSHAAQEYAGPPTAKDPVCGLDVAAGTAKQAGRTSEYQGKTYYFDTEGCKQRFDHAPQRYLSGSSEAPLPQTYPNVPTDPNMLLRLRRDLLRAVPPGKGQELPQGPSQGVPQEPPVKPQEPQTPPSPPQVPPPAPPHGGGHQHD